MNRTQLTLQTSGNNFTAFEFHEVLEITAPDEGRISADFRSAGQPGNPARRSIVDLAARTMVRGERYTMASPCGLNCSYTIQFDGPYLKCNSSTTSVVSLPSSLETTVFEADWLKFNKRRSKFENVPEGPFQLKNLRDCHYNVFDNYTTITCTQETMSCYPQRAQYHVNQTFQNGQQRSTVQMGQIFDLLPAEDGAAASPVTNPTRWNQGLNATAAAYIRDVNILGLIMAMTSSLSGSYSTFANPGPERTRVNNASISWDQYDIYLSWSGKVSFSS